jgi:predicted nucleic acid-binding protein
MTNVRTKHGRGPGRPHGTLVLDSAGLSGYASGNLHVLSTARRTRANGGRVVVAATTLTEVLRGAPRDAEIHRALKSVTVEPISQELARRAGALLGSTGLSGHRCALDSLVAAVALDCARPVLLLTSDVDDLTALTEEHDRAKHERIAVHHV